MLTDKQLKMLRSAVVYDPSKVPTDLPPFNVTAEDISIEQLKKLNERLCKFGKKLPFDKYTFIKECDIGSLTGKQILQLFMKILNEPEKYKAGNCLLFSIDGKTEIACGIEGTGYLMVRKCKRNKDCDKKMYEKIFDDEEFANYPQARDKPWSTNFDPRKIEGIRKQVSDQLKKFLNNSVESCEPCYRCPFLRMLEKIAKLEVNRDGMLEEIIQLHQVPVAACVKLAVDSQQTGKLQQVFGSRGVHNGIKVEIKRKFVAEHGVEISDDELLERTLQEKKRLRFEAAEEIIQSSFVERNEDGRYNDDVIEQVKKDVKKFFM
ncbi:uncharacterized protein LOC100182729 [Ciona intestinalis]